MLRIFGQVERYRKEMLEASRQLAATGNPKGLYEMGYRYLYGWDIEQDFTGTLKYLSP